MLYRHEIISLHVHQDRGGDYMHHLHRLLSGHIGLDYQPCTVATTVGSHADADADADARPNPGGVPVSNDVVSFVHTST
jgi:hypothetical protein